MLSPFPFQFLKTFSVASPLKFIFCKPGFFWKSGCQDLPSLTTLGPADSSMLTFGLTLLGKYCFYEFISSILVYSEIVHLCLVVLCLLADCFVSPHFNKILINTILVIKGLYSHHFFHFIETFLFLLLDS